MSLTSVGEEHRCGNCSGKVYLQADEGEGGIAHLHGGVDGIMEVE
jgi:hypothetical protein